VLADRPEGGVQALLWNDTRVKLDKLVALMVLHGGRKVRLGAALLPADASTAALATDMARCAQVRASAATPLIYASEIDYRPPERRVISTSSAIATVNKAIEDVAWTHAPVFLQGEAGSGKEAVARTIHRWSSLRESAFASINCEVVPHDLLMQVLTAALGGQGENTTQSSAEGELHFAGTIYFSRVESLPPAAREALMQRLASKEHREANPRSAQARFIFGTSRDLDQSPESAGPHSVFYRRIGGTAIRVPPLRERREDLAALIQDYLEYFTPSFARGPLLLSSEAMRHLLEYPFPGNLPELRYEIGMAARRSTSGLLTAETFSATLRTPTGLSPGVTAASDTTFQGFDLKRRVQAFEAQLIVRALDVCGWNQTEAARRLNIPRRTLVYKMRQLGIRRASSRGR